MTTYRQTRLPLRLGSRLPLVVAQAVQAETVALAAAAAVVAQRAAQTAAQLLLLSPLLQLQTQQSPLLWLLLQLLVLLLLLPLLNLALHRPRQQQLLLSRHSPLPVLCPHPLLLALRPLALMLVVLTVPAWALRAALLPLLAAR